MYRCLIIYFHMQKAMIHSRSNRRYNIRRGTRERTPVRPQRLRATFRGSNHGQHSAKDLGIGEPGGAGAAGFNRWAWMGLKQMGVPFIQGGAPVR